MKKISTCHDRKPAYHTNRGGEYDVPGKGGDPMKMADVRQKAEGLGIAAGRMKKTDLIRRIQQAEGYSPCYGTSNGTCAQMECCFRDDCLKVR